MFAKVLKPFAYAHDHTTVRHLKADDEVEIDNLVAPGLQAEGFIEPAAPAAPEA